MLGALALSVVMSGCTSETPSTGDTADASEIVGTDEYMELINHPDDGVLEFVVGPFDIATGAPHLRLPIQKTEIPFDLYGYGFDWEIRNSAGEKLPDDLLHHMNIIDIDSRELFSPVARRIVAAGRETSSIEFPKIVGIPVTGGHRVWLVSMFGNPTGEDFTDAYLHVNLKYTLPEDGILPTMEVYTFYMDVTGFVGPKDFPIPPGRSENEYTASPGADGKILGIGGHLHDYGTEIRLEDATEGEVIWAGTPIVNEQGRTTGVSKDLLLTELGLDIYADHEYRIVVVHENPTEEYASDGGMGAIAGIMTVTGDGDWPELDSNDPDYLEDLENTLLEPERNMEHGGHGDMDGMDMGSTEMGGMDIGRMDLGRIDLGGTEMGEMDMDGTDMGGMDMDGGGAVAEESDDH